MAAYLPVVCIISFFVDLMLFIFVCKWCHHPIRIAGICVGAVVGGVYTGWCLVPGFHFLGNIFWRLVFLVLRAVPVFGLYGKSLRQYGLFLMLHLVLTGVVTWIGASGIWTMIASILVMMILSFISVWGKKASNYIQVELLYGQKKLQVTALRDTGNALRDPITGKSVLVLGAEAACKLTGLTRDQLRTPVETMGILPGLRLIPYKTIGQGGLLLALQIPMVKIGQWQGSTLVALAPESVGSENTYQALAGGTV